MASRVRMQFYRFKNQEYVLASRTLGASDFRIMFKHIFPNSLGTIITGSVLVIPSVIFSETSLSYLGIINLDSASVTSIGAMLSAGQTCMTSAPHVVFFPALFIALLMISFNLFGNGLRDAFTDMSGQANIPVQMAAVAVVSFPLFLVFIFLRKYIMKGVSRSGIKG